MLYALTERQLQSTPQRERECKPQKPHQAFVSATTSLHYIFYNIIYIECLHTYGGKNDRAVTRAHITNLESFKATVTFHNVQYEGGIHSFHNSDNI